ncbi:MAG: hypothetical protein LBV02_05055, partial [Bacteroidales bacterium]|nr:hypothetical protein [Bacteroidales bacterium]
MICSKTVTLVIFLILFVGSACTFTANAQSHRYYWVGKGDRTSYTDLMNWSDTPDGPGGTAGGVSQSPNNATTLVFNTHMFTFIQISSNQQCDSIIVEANCTYPPYFVLEGPFTVNGSLLFKRTGVNFHYGLGPLIFESSRARESIQTSGAVLVGLPQNKQYSDYYLVYTTMFSGSATYDLLDNLTCCNINVSAGTLNLNGHNISTSEFTVGASGKVTFANSVIDCKFTWNHAPAVTLAESKGSLIRIGSGDLITPANSEYHNVEFYAGVDRTYKKTHQISSGRYNKITILKGESELSSTAAPITVDSLVISAAYYHRFYKMTVNSYFEAKPAGCGGQLRLSGMNGYKSKTNITNRTLTYKGTEGNFIVERAVLHDFVVAGTKTFTAGKSYDWGNNSANLTFTAPDMGRDMYWTGGAGSWSDPAHWADRSGAPLNCVPTLADNVFFTASANTNGTAISQKNPVNLDVHVWCHDMVWNGVPGVPYLRSYGDESSLGMDFTSVKVMIGGSLELQSSLKFNSPGNVNHFQSDIYFIGDGDETINANGCHFYAYLYLQSVSGTGRWTLLNDMLLYNAQSGSDTMYVSITHNRGAFNTNGKKIVALSFMSETDTESSTLTGFTTRLPSRQLNIANSTIDLRSSWYYIGGQPLQAGQSLNSNIIMGIGRTKHNDHYHNMEMRY